MGVGMYVYRDVLGDRLEPWLDDQPRDRYMIGLIVAHKHSCRSKMVADMLSARIQSAEVGLILPHRGTLPRFQNAVSRTGHRTINRL
jgi:hypothetical protein